MINWLLGLFGYEYITADDPRTGIVALDWYVVEAKRMIVKKEWVLPQQYVADGMGAFGLVQVVDGGWKCGRLQFRLVQ